MLPPYEHIASPERLTCFKVSRHSPDGASNIVYITAHGFEPLDDLADTLAFYLLTMKKNAEGTEYEYAKPVYMLKGWWEVESTEIPVIN